VRPLTSHPLIHSAYDASQQSFQTVASHQTATANLGVGSGIASHYTRTLRLRNICTGAPTGGLGFKAYYKAFQYEPSLSWEYKPWLMTITNGVEALIRTTATLGRNDASRRAHWITKALTGVTTQ
jgi:hypothetical protein